MKGEISAKEVVVDCRRRLAAPPTVMVHGEHRIRPHEQSDCMGAHSKGYCVRPRCLRLLPSTSEARHVPSQVREARTERFVKFLYGCHLDTAMAVLGSMHDGATNQSL